MVGVGHRGRGDLPGLVPLQLVLVHQQAHQFRDGADRMGVIQLEAVPLRKQGEIVAVMIHPVFDDILEACRAVEVLLAQAQQLAGLGVIARVEDHGDFFRLDFRCDGHLVVAGIESVEIEGVAGLGGPEAQQIHPPVDVSRDRDIMGYRHHVLGSHETGVRPTVAIDVVLRVSEEGHPAGLFASLDFPGITTPQPAVGLLCLVAVFDGLVEHPEAVAQSVADHRQIQRGTAVQKTGG